MTSKNKNTQKSNTPTTVAKSNSHSTVKKKRKKPTVKEDNDQYLVAKIGHEAEFLKAVTELNKIHTGKLGFRGNAQIILEMGLFSYINVEFKGKTDEEKLDEAEQVLRNIFGSQLIKHGEWVTGTVADNREVLFSDIPTSNTED